MTQEHPEEHERDLVAEARSIIDGTSILLPQVEHLTALWELYILKSEALDKLLAEVRTGSC